MSPRQNRRRSEERDESGPQRALGGERTEDFAGVPYVVRSVSGSGAAKTYRCPGCDHEVVAGTPHLVAWPLGDDDASDRRHWHTPCWSARNRRAPRLRRGRDAPHYG